MLNVVKNFTFVFDQMRYKKILVAKLNIQCKVSKKTLKKESFYLHIAFK